MPHRCRFTVTPGTRASTGTCPRDGDTLVVTRIGCFAQSLKAKGVAQKPTEPPLDTGTAAGKAFLDMLGVFAEFETNLPASASSKASAPSRRPLFEYRCRNNAPLTTRSKARGGHSPREEGQDADPSLRSENLFLGFEQPEQALWCHRQLENVGA